MKAVLLASIAALALPAVAGAHDTGGWNNGPYTGPDCGGQYHSPTTGHDWVDCASNVIPDRLESRVDPRTGITYFDVYRTYAHIVDGQFSHRSERYAYSFS